MGAQHLARLFTGPTGIGKSWLAQALAQKACRDGYTVWYRPAPKLFRELAVARADGSLGRVLETIARTDVLVVDDFLMRHWQNWSGAISWRSATTATAGARRF
jgi:DNA replication protein DnaC